MGYSLEEISNFSYALALIFCVSCNALLIYLIFTKSPKYMGSYRYLMTFFSINGLLHSIFDYVAKPIFIMLSANQQTGSILMFFVLNKHFPTKWISVIASEMYGFFLGVIFTVFAIHFVYRYWTISRNDKIRFFDFPYFLIWVILVYYFGFEYCMILHIEFGERPDKTEFFREKMRVDFNHTMDEISYIAARFVKMNDEGYLSPDWRQIAFYFAAVKTVIISFIIVIVCGIKIVRHIRKDLQVLSSKDRSKVELNLFIALVVQTTIPVVMIYAPFLLMWNFPYIGTFETASMLGIGVALYPGIDPLAIIFIVSSYRRWVLKPFRKRRFRVSQASGSATNRVSTSVKESVNR